MQTKPAQSDPFDLDFEADDEFASPRSPEEPWRHDTLEEEGDRAGPGVAHDDPFVGIAPPSQPDLAPFPEVLAPEPVGEVLDELTPAETHPASAHQEESSALEEPAAQLMVAPPAAVPEPIPTPATVLGEPVAPRITINAFCSTQTAIDLVKSAAGDRRMERASTIVRLGGLAAAVEHYQNQSTPSLVIVEATEGAGELLALLSRLAEVCDPGTKVMVIGVANDIALYRELMRQGISDYLVPPLKTLQLISAITSLYADPAAPFIGRQISFCGAKGGVGSSTLAHNVAYEISERMTAGTVIVDLDLAFGTAALDFNHDPLQGVADALSQPDRLDPVLMDRMMAKHSDHLSLFAAPATLDQDYEIGSDVFEEVIRKIRMASPYVVLDLPHAWSRWKRRMLLTSDDLVVVAEPDLACLRNAKNIIDLVRAARPHDAPPRVVLNKVGVPGRPEIPLKDFGEALGVTPSLSIPFDAKAFGQAANNGQMITNAGTRSKAVESIDQLIRMMLNQRGAPAAPSAKSSVFSGLFKRR
ncbi:MAG TPA: AAA family ATPase [Caulobacteraceae bacterium]